MKNLLRDLAENAEVPNDHKYGYWTFNNDQLEYLFDSIIRECFKTIDKEISIQEDNVLEEYDEGVLLGLEKAKKAIQIEFGVV